MKSLSIESLILLANTDIVTEAGTLLLIICWVMHSRALSRSDSYPSVFRVFVVCLRSVIFGMPGSSKGPLLFMLLSIIFWAYPTYVFKVMWDLYQCCCSRGKSLSSRTSLQVLVHKSLSLSLSSDFKSLSVSSSLKSLSLSSNLKSLSVLLYYIMVSFTVFDEGTKLLVLIIMK